MGIRVSIPAGPSNLVMKSKTQPLWNGEFPNIPLQYLTKQSIEEIIADNSPYRIVIDNIPPEVKQAAKLLHNYFQERGVRSWQFMDICSRNHAYCLDRIDKVLKENNIE